MIKFDPTLGLKNTYKLFYTAAIKELSLHKRPGAQSVSYELIVHGGGFTYFVQLERRPQHFDCFIRMLGHDLQTSYRLSYQEVEALFNNFRIDFRKVHGNSCLIRMPHNAKKKAR